MIWRRKVSSPNKGDNDKPSNNTLIIFLILKAILLIILAMGLASDWR